MRDRRTRPVEAPRTPHAKRCAIGLRSPHSALPSSLMRPSAESMESVRVRAQRGAVTAQGRHPARIPAPRTLCSST